MLADATVHGFRATFCDWASEVANAPREIAEMSLSHKVGSNVEQAYTQSDLLDRMRALMESWSAIVSDASGAVQRGFRLTLPCRGDGWL